MINIWHDIDPSRVTPESFTAVIEIPAGSKKKYELDKHAFFMGVGLISFSYASIIRQITALFRALMRVTAIRWMCSCCAVKRLTRWSRWTAIRSA